MIKEKTTYSGLFCWNSIHKVLYFYLRCRLDSLVGLFAVGCQPSSTSDPFGLRRISYGLVSYLEIIMKYNNYTCIIKLVMLTSNLQVQILVEKDKNLDLGQALRLAADVQPIKVDTDVIDNVRHFFFFFAPWKLC